MNKIFYFVLSEPRRADRYFEVHAETERMAKWRVVDESEGSVCSVELCPKETAEGMKPEVLP